MQTEDRTRMSRVIASNDVKLIDEMMDDFLRRMRRDIVLIYVNSIIPLYNSDFWTGIKPSTIIHLMSKMTNQAPISVYYVGQETNMYIRYMSFHPDESGTTELIYRIITIYNRIGMRRWAYHEIFKALYRFGHFHTFLRMIREIIDVHIRYTKSTVDITTEGNMLHIFGIRFDDSFVTPVKMMSKVFDHEFKRCYDRKVAIDTFKGLCTNLVCSDIENEICSYL